MRGETAATGYDVDFAAWATAQVAALRGGHWVDLDGAHLTEEIESLVHSNRREMRRRLTLVAMHLLNGQFQPEKRSRSWIHTIRVQAREVEKFLTDSPSLRREMPDVIRRAYADARQDASDETGLTIATFPAAPTPEFARALRAALAGDDVLRKFLSRAGDHGNRRSLRKKSARPFHNVRARRDKNSGPRGLRRAGRLRR